MAATETNPQQGGQAAPPRRRRSIFRLAHRASCPHCGSTRVEGHGTYPRKDGSRQPRQRCRTCTRTFNVHTGTPLNWIKKRAEWQIMTATISRWMPVRRMAAALCVQVTTAFRWRHRLFAAVSPQPQPVLTGTVAASEAYVPYSEKGSRRPGGPGSVGAQSARGIFPETGPSRFRRFVHGQPSFVLLACAGEQQAVVLTGAGRPSASLLKASLQPLLGTRARVQAVGLAPYAQACRLLGVPCAEAAQGRWLVDGLRRQFYAWLHPMRGVATRYLLHYVTWFSLRGRPIPLPVPMPPAA